MRQTRGATRHDSRQALAPERAVVLGDRESAASGGARSRAARSGRAAGGPAGAARALGAIQPSGGSHVIRTRSRGPCAVREVAATRRCRVAPAQRRDVRLLGPVQHVARREHAGRARCAGRRRPPGRACPGRARCRQHRQLVVGDPVGAEDDGVARHAAGAAAVEVGQLDLLHPRAARGSRSPRVRVHTGTR